MSKHPGGTHITDSARRRIEEIMAMETRTSPMSPVSKCLRCGVRLTLCGVPFTAVIKCYKCKAVHVFNNSQQPSEVLF